MLKTRCSTYHLPVEGGDGWSVVIEERSEAAFSRTEGTRPATSLTPTHRSSTSTGASPISEVIPPRGLMPLCSQSHLGAHFGPRAVAQTHVTVRAIYYPAHTLNMHGIGRHGGPTLAPEQECYPHTHRRGRSLGCPSLARGLTLGESKSSRKGGWVQDSTHPQHPSPGWGV